MAESKRLKIILTSLESQGCTVIPTKKGWQVRFPDGENSIQLHTSESDHRAEKNTRARVIRAGLLWPFDSK